MQDVVRYGAYLLVAVAAWFGHRHGVAAGLHPFASAALLMGGGCALGALERRLLRRHRRPPAR
jgi:hypothetical protein